MQVKNVHFANYRFLFGFIALLQITNSKPLLRIRNKKEKKTMTFIKTIEARRHVDEQELWDVREVIL